LLNPCHVISLLEIYLLAALPYANPKRFNRNIQAYSLIVISAKKENGSCKMEERKRSTDERKKERKKEKVSIRDVCI
jgi:hypothetical protein